jgi:S-adenosylmethionine:tRNA ribosyltransferase-isomerase
MLTADFDFILPEDRIALTPVIPRESAKMLVIRPNMPLADQTVGDLADLLSPGDAIVFNNTRVIAAALEGHRVRAGVSAKVAFNLHKRVGPDRWLAFARPAKRLIADDRVDFGATRALSARVVTKGDAGEIELQFDCGGAELDAAITSVGSMPLPPYIALKRGTTEADEADYQTIFAREPGAVAAPTAGLHFTDDLLAKLKARGVSMHFVTLHVGAGTFLPVKVDDTRDHKMHAEWCEVSAETASALNAVRARGGRVVAAGTTALRVLETAAQSSGQVRAFSGDTSIFITPGYAFRAVDVLMTNFHLPRSTLFMLVSAFSGVSVMRDAYNHAIVREYRFYSYGDASLLFRDAADAVALRAL